MEAAENQPPPGLTCLKSVVILSFLSAVIEPEEKGLEEELDSAQSSDEDDTAGTFISREKK